MVFNCLICDGMIFMPNLRPESITYHYCCMVCWNSQTHYKVWAPIPTGEWGLNDLSVRTGADCYSSGDYDGS